MTLTVETGAGLAAADSLVARMDFTAYCTARGLAIAAGTTDAQVDAALRVGSEYVSAYKRWKGTRLTAAQAFEWPRTGLSDWSGHPVTGVPRNVRFAVCEAAWRALTGALFADAARGGQVASESVGPVSVSYFPGAPVARKIEVIDSLLAQYARQALDYIAPVWTPPAAPGFRAGQMDGE